jgi:hypothetical protein
MPRFFFHIIGNEDPVRDLEGSCLADIEMARDEAKTAIRELVADAVRASRALQLFRHIQIADEDGLILAEVQFVDAVNLTG